MIMSHRGTEGEPIVGQVPMGKATPKVLDAMELEYFNPKIPLMQKVLYLNLGICLLIKDLLFQYY